MFKWLKDTLSGKKDDENKERYNLKNPITTYNLDIIDLNEDVDIDINDTFIANGIVAHNAACPTKEE